MSVLTRRTVMTALGILALGAPALGATTPYVLDRSASRVGFQFSLNDVSQSGSMPVQQANIVIDPRNLAASAVDVTVNVQQARTGLIFATQALVGQSVLDADRFPTIRFVSDSIQLNREGRLSDGARIRGNLTMRGVTRPISLDADVYRARGSAPDDLSQLTVRLAGKVSRSAFGASGFPDLVDDLVRLDITAVIRSQT